MPYFISTVVIVGILKSFSGKEGLFNQVRSIIGLEPILFFQEPEYFRSLFIASGIWQGLGFGSIIYLAALSNINPELYDSAVIDGANRFQRVIYVTLPSILPTITILLILSVGGILGTDTQKVLLMYNPLTYETADVIGTYIYREGLMATRYSYGTAIGLVLNTISFIFVAIFNKIAQKISETSLW